MIELNNKTRQDFLDRSFVKKLQDVGIDMSDAKYLIIHVDSNDKDYVILKSQLDSRPDWADKVTDTVPTYTMAELFYKLNEWPSIKLIENGNEKYIGAKLELFKDAPFYFACYYFGKTERDCNLLRPEDKREKDWEFKCNEYRKYDIEAYSEYPIEAMAYLLIASAKSDFHNFNYVKDVSDK